MLGFYFWKNTVEQLIIKLKCKYLGHNDKYFHTYSHSGKIIGVHTCARCWREKKKEVN